MPATSVQNNNLLEECIASNLPVHIFRAGLTAKQQTQLDMEIAAARDQIDKESQLLNGSGEQRSKSGK